MIYKPVPYIIGEVVQNVRNNYLPEHVIPYYDFGSGLEVVNRLTEKTKSSIEYDKKYPLVWYLIEGSLKQEVTNTDAIKRKTKSVTIIICTETKSEYSSAERYNATFIPTLIPIYDSLMFYLSKHKELKSLDKFKHTYEENLFWGRDGLYGHDGNIFNDRLDAIIISNLDLLVIENC